MRPFLVTLIAFAVLATGCAATAPDPNYAAYIKLVEAERTAEAGRYTSLAAASQSCTDARCVENVAALTALAMAGRGSAMPSAQIYRKQYHPAWGIVGQAIPALISGAVAWRSSDNSRDIALGQYDFLGGVIGSVTNSPALTPRDPSITVGGDYITGSQHVGDAIGGDYITGQVGDAVGRDQIAGDQHVGDEIGGDRVDNSGLIGNDNRVGSPGPWDNSGQCTGPLCQGDGDITPPPEPEPVEPEGG